MGFHRLVLTASQVVLVPIRIFEASQAGCIPWVEDSSFRIPSYTFLIFLRGSRSCIAHITSVGSNSLTIPDAPLLFTCCTRHMLRNFGIDLLHLLRVVNV